MKTRKFVSLLEALETRALLSISPIQAPMAILQKLQHPAAVTPVVAPTAGPALNLTTRTPFTGILGFYASPVIDPPLGLSATINWGDGVTSKATIQYAMHGDTGGYEIIGTHTYTNPGIFKVTTLLSEGPISGITGPTATLATKLLAQYVSVAIVTRPIGNSPGGVTIHETAGQSFTEVLGTFSTIAPATNLHATITWGDGSVSLGKLTPTGVTGVDVVNFSVSGTHTYARAGIVPIHIIVTRLLRDLTAASPIQPVATIDSTAIVTSAGTFSLAGTLTGTYQRLATSTVADAGAALAFTGSGTLADTGAVQVAGAITSPGFILTGHAAGRLTLSNSQGTVVLQVLGPPQVGFGPFPDALNYSVIQATGAFAGKTASGTIAVTLTPSATASGQNQFTFVLS
jgi:hypothetical protein